MPRKKRIPDCHPDQKHVARGKCVTCYNAARKTDPEKEREYNRTYRANNREQRRASDRRYYSTTKARASWIGRRYGLTIADYQHMLNSQGGLCAICRIAKATHIDHDHKTKNVRAILCNSCNSVLGHAKDSTEILSAAIAFLEKHGHSDPEIRKIKIN